MHLLYLDDSGSVANTHEEYFVLGGVSVPEKSIRWLSYEIEKVAEEIDPQNSRQIEFHASEVFRGRTDPWRKYSKKEERIAFIKKVLLVMENAFREIVIFACAIHKSSYPSEDLITKAFEQLSDRFDKYLQRISTSKQKEIGLIILDKTTHETSLQNLARSFRAEGNRWRSDLRSIPEIPLFVDSKASRIIQLADHIAYAVFRRYNAEDLTYFNCLEGRFDKNEGIIHGLVHLQTVKAQCTCPACITRR